MIERGDVIVKIEGLYKKYAKAKAYAVTDLSLECRAGEIVGLIGRNGAGKSTTIKCLTGYLSYEKGKISICGRDVRKDPVRAKQELGYVPDNSAVFEQMTGAEYLNFIADLHRTPTGVRQTRVRELQSVFRLGSRLDSMISTYSHGMHQKICLMASLIHRPKLWLLDEPITGLDPQTAAALCRYMVFYKRKGNAVLYSSHNLDTVARTCDRVYLINGGKIAGHLDLTQFPAAEREQRLSALFAEKVGETV